MRIANNIMAMNTHRAYTQNNDRVQTSAEKLSSGYRINRAGDDAAGLAISEKMRSQIRGLNMSTKNSQDAVSLIQTAEGALQEVHSMLQRMNELAVQSATGTNEGFDRTQIAKEFEQLKREINDISEQTTFNNMNILDGSLSAKGLQRTEYTSGVYKTFEAADPTAALGGVNNVQNGVGTQYKMGVTASFSVDVKNVKVKDGGDTALTVNVAGKDYALTGLNSNSDIAAALAEKIGTDPITIKVGNEDVKFTAAAVDGKVVFTATDMAKNIDKKDIGNLEYSVKGTATGDKATAGKTDGTKVSGVVGGTAEVKAESAVTTFNFDFEQTKSGDVLKIGQQTFVFYDSQEDALTTDQRDAFAKSNFMLDLQKINTGSALATAIGTAENVDGFVSKATGAQADGSIADEAKISASANGNTITIKYAGTGALGSRTDNESTGGIYGTASTKYVAVGSAHVNTLPDAASVQSTTKLDAATKVYNGDNKITKGAFTFGKVTSGADTVAGTARSLEFDLTGSDWEFKGEIAANAPDKTLFKLTNADGTKTYGVIKLADDAPLFSGSVTAQNLGAITNALVAGSKATLVMNDGSGSFGITVSGNKLTFAGADTAIKNLEGINAAGDLKLVVANAGNFNGTTTAQVANAGALGTPQINGVTATFSFDVDTTKLNAGDKFTIGGHEFEIINDSTKGTGQVGSTAQINIANKDSKTADELKAAIMDGIVNALNTTTIGFDSNGTGNTASVAAKDGDTITITSKKIGTAGDPFKNAAGNVLGFISNPNNKSSAVTLDMVTANNPAGKGTTTFEIDTLKLKQGDKLSYTTSKGGIDTTLVHEYKEGQTVADITKTFGIDQAQVDGNSWQVKDALDQGSKLKFEAAQDYKAGTYDTMKIQVGALEGEQLAIKIGAMNTAGLGLDDQKIYTQADAGKAVTATRNAINTVSDQRALLGAMQNRMTHKIANLKVSVENLQASESRIRDIDIASEMTTFTKNNILSQAATSMLAQANSAPQNVLSLLR